MIDRTLNGVKRRLIGPPERLPQRVLTALILMTVAIAATGGWYALSSGVDTGTSSLPYLRPFLAIATSVWAWLIGLVWILRRVLVHRDQRYAGQAASVTGYEPRSVRRLAYEAKSPDGSTRVIASTGDEPEEIEERILNALESGEDDRIKLNPEAVSGEEVDVQLTDEEELLERAAELDQEINDDLQDVLESDADPDALVEVLEGDEDRVAPVELLDDEQRERVEEIEAKVEELEAVTAELDRLQEPDDVQEDASPDFENLPDLEDYHGGWRSRGSALARRAGAFLLASGKVAAAGVLAYAGWLALVVYGPQVALIRSAVFAGLELVESTTGVGAGAVYNTATGPLAFAGVTIAAAALVALRELLAAWRRRADRRQDAAGGSADGAAGGSAGGNEPETEPDDVEDDVRDPWREDLKLFRLDLASTLNFSEITWQLLLPAGVAIVLMLLSVQLWVQVWVYPVIFAAGLLVGVLNYMRVSWKRSRRLKALRKERESVNWSDVSVLVKEVEVPETRIYYAWMGDAEPRRYAHDDQEEFAEEVAHRAYELVEGVPVSPSVMEKQATELEKMHPDLHGFRDTEKEAIMTWLLEHVEDSQHGLVPKAKLIEDCIEHDLQGRRFAPGRRGEGYDPDLVREAYRELVPAALVEQEVDVSREDVEDDQDEPLTLTAVRLRTEPLPPEYGQIRAAFSSRFGNYARWTPMYELPDVSDRLGGEPEYVSSLLRREGPTP